MIDLEAAIVPGVSAAGILLRSDLTSLPPEPPVSEDKRLTTELVLRDFGPVKVWLNKDRVVQVCVLGSYKGTLRKEVSIGSTIAEVGAFFGRAVIEDAEDNLVVPDSPGWCFETEEWGGTQTIEENFNARITSICVFEV